MAIEKLVISHFRNLHQVECNPAQHINVIYGRNASGKTSFLEAIYFLGHVASFRTSRFDRLLEKGQDELTVFASLIEKNGKKVPIGVKKGQKNTQIRINEQKIGKVSSLAQTLPIQIIHPNSHQLLEEGPEIRRRFLDWGVFHVEHNYINCWQAYQKSLKQRNAAIRQSGRKDLVQAWDKELIQHANELTAYRKSYIKELQVEIGHYIQPVLGEIDIQLRYKPGWNNSEPFESSLKQSIQTDIERGFTTVGPHRADIGFMVDGVLATQRVSRGQQKILVTAMLLAQTGVFNQKTGKEAILLIDDVAAELDDDNRNRLLKVLQTLKVQMFVTAIDPDSLRGLMQNDNNSKMFHVEQGILKQVK